MFQSQPATIPPEFPHWCLTLDQVHGCLENIRRWLLALIEPPIDLTPIGHKLKESYEKLYELLSLRIDPYTSFTELNQRLSDLEINLITAGDEPHLSAAAGQCKLALTQLESVRPTIQSMHWVSAPPTFPMRATLVEPLLHRIPRAHLLPDIEFASVPLTEVFNASPARPKPQNFAELREAVEAMTKEAQAKRDAKTKSDSEKKEEVPQEKPASRVEGFEADPLPQLSPEEFRRERARDTFEEIAMIGVHRLPLLGDPWRASLIFEKRMFENLDALVALGDAGLNHLQKLTLGSPIKDPSRLFALTLVAGCVEGRDTLALAERYFDEEHLSDPAYSRAFVHALRMVPHPWVTPRYRSLLTSESAALRKVAVEVLGHLQQLSLDELHERCKDEPEVAAAALPYFAIHDDPRVLEVLDRGITFCDEQEADTDVFRGVARALAIADHPESRRFFWRHSRGPHADYATLILGLTANRAVAEELLNQCLETPTPGFITALSWAGPYQAVDALIGVLETAKDDELKSAAGYGLERLTAGGFIEGAEIPPEKLEDPELPEPDVGDTTTPSLSQRVSSPRDMPSEGSADIIERPSTDPAPWRALWEQQRPRFKPEHRVRRGLFYSPFVTLDELDNGRYTPGERRALVTELVIRTGQWVPLDPEDLVVTQERAIAKWRGAIDGKGRHVGGWERANRRIW